MARDPIRILLMVRRQAVEDARRVLAACLTAEAAAAVRLQQIDDEAQENRSAQLTIEDAHRFLETFARRVQASGAQRYGAEADLTAAQAQTAEARTAVVAARVATQALETLIAERAAADLVEANRREQHALDDMTRNRVDNINRPVARDP
jgi:flagellar protein FliJ